MSSNKLEDQAFVRQNLDQLSQRAHFQAVLKGQPELGDAIVAVLDEARVDQFVIKLLQAILMNRADEEQIMTFGNYLSLAKYRLLNWALAEDDDLSLKLIGLDQFTDGEVDTAIRCMTGPYTGNAVLSHPMKEEVQRVVLNHTLKGDYEKAAALDSIWKASIVHPRLEPTLQAILSPYPTSEIHDSVLRRYIDAYKSSTTSPIPKPEWFVKKLYDDSNLTEEEKFKIKWGLMSPPGSAGKKAPRYTKEMASKNFQDSLRAIMKKNQTTTDSNADATNSDGANSNADSIKGPVKKKGIATRKRPTTGYTVGARKKAKVEG